MGDLFDDLFGWEPPELPLSDSYVEPLDSEVCYILDANQGNPWQLK